MIGFTFYRDYFNLIDTLPSREDKMILLEAITDYMFKDIEPKLEGHNQAIFNTLRYQLNVSKNNAGRGGRKNKEKTQKEIELTTEKKPNEQPNENPKGNPLKNKTSISNFLFYISNLDINNNIKDILNKWLNYKYEIKDLYKSETSLKILVNKVIKNCEVYGEDKINELVDDAIANGYKGIVWERLGVYNNRPKTQSERNREFLDKMRSELEDGEEESN